jgi:hypothetical protein
MARITNNKTIAPATAPIIAPRLLLSPETLLSLGPIMSPLLGLDGEVGFPKSPVPIPVLGVKEFIQVPLATSKTSGVAPVNIFISPALIEPSKIINMPEWNAHVA